MRWTSFTRRRASSHCAHAIHWNAIATLPSLEDLSFHSCRFPGGPAYVEPEKRVKAKPSRLWLLDATTGFREPFASIDVRCLRALAADPESFFNLVLFHSFPQSLEALALSLVDGPPDVEHQIRLMLDELVRKNQPLLQSLTLCINTPNLIRGPFLSHEGCWSPHTSTIIYIEKLRDRSGDFIHRSSAYPSRQTRPFLQPQNTTQQTAASVTSFCVSQVLRTNTYTSGSLACTLAPS
ncbi:hypothetical protein HD554DRAFT_1469321 [Boletus coccyginus]|nr:hypothetical protein HD554DRAFT_1469321 [Boletus coccyginus]